MRPGTAGGEGLVEVPLHETPDKSPGRLDKDVNDGLAEARLQETQNQSPGQLGKGGDEGLVGQPALGDHVDLAPSPAPLAPGTPEGGASRGGASRGSPNKLEGGTPPISYILSGVPTDDCAPEGPGLKLPYAGEARAANADCLADTGPDADGWVEQPLLDRGFDKQPLLEDAEAAKRRLGTAPRWQCGAQRLQLRQEFNTHEINAALIMRKYDVDGSGTLEVEELKQLLQDYNQGRPVEDQELQNILATADMDNDSCISADEVLYALKVWYAFKHMPKSIGAAFTRYGIGGGPLPSRATLHEAMMTLNDSLPVPMEEIQYVRAVAMRLGASEQQATVEQMRGAIAAWYLHIQREETGRSRLFEDAHRSVVQRLSTGLGAVSTQLSGTTPAGDAAHSAFAAFQDGWSSVAGPCLASVLVGAAVLVPTLEMWVGMYHDSETCEHDLSSVVYWTGVLSFWASLFGGVMAAARWIPNDKLAHAATVLVYPSVLAALLLLALWVTGLNWVLRSSAAKCGMVLWGSCSFVYVTLPALLLLLVCCGPCCWYCCCGGLFFAERCRADRQLMDP